MADATQDYDLEGLAALVDADPGHPDFPALAEAVRRGGDPARARRIAEAGLEAAPGRLAGRVALGLALLDLERTADARSALATILDPVLEPHRVDEAVLAPGPPSAPSGDAVGRPLDDDEIDLAFASAEPQVDEMISPNRMAERVLLDHAPVGAADADDLALDEGDEPGFAEADGLALDAADESVFDTAAELGIDSAAEAGIDVADAADTETDDDEPLELDEPGPRFRTATMAELLDRQGDTAGAEAIRRALAGGGRWPSRRGIDEVGDVSDFALDEPFPAAAEALGPARAGGVAGEAPPADAAVAVGWPDLEPPSADTMADTPAETGEAPPGREDVPAAARILSTLERWLENIQRGQA